MNFFKKLLRKVGKEANADKSLELENKNSDYDEEDEIMAVITAALVSIELSNEDEIIAAIVAALSTLEEPLDMYEVAAIVVCIIDSIQKELKIAVQNETSEDNNEKI